MGSEPKANTIGVEEEFHLVDRTTRQLAPIAEQVGALANERVREGVHAELRTSQIEIATPVCQTLSQVRQQVRLLRAALTEAAGEHDGAIIASGTHPFSAWNEQGFTGNQRYEDLHRAFRHLAREQVISGCHVHVGLADPDVRVFVLNRARVWLSPLLALAANSPYWQGEDTGYASFRTLNWSRWPISGPPQWFADDAEYQSLVNALVRSGAIEDATRIYWDIRLPDHIPTIEFRVMDVCPTVDETVMCAGLIRALVHTCYDEEVRGAPYSPVRQEILRSAHWRAARDGLDAELLDVVSGELAPAKDVIERLLGYLRPALETLGDWEEASALVDRTLRHGNGAARQRAVVARGGRLEDVVDLLVAETSEAERADDANLQTGGDLSHSQV
ncbi:MAG: glutamate--cysteine ligase [Chloroflexota bacterium]|nr:glutamate--cysteine ligase [Chloroflexota bacterium]